jgi:hypothetical protein
MYNIASKEIFLLQNSILLLALFNIPSFKIPKMLDEWRG